MDCLIDLHGSTCTTSGQTTVFTPFMWCYMFEYYIISEGFSLEFASWYKFNQIFLMCKFLVFSFEIAFTKLVYSLSINIPLNYYNLQKSS